MSNGEGEEKPRNIYVPYIHVCTYICIYVTLMYSTLHVAPKNSECVYKILKLYFICNCRRQFARQLADSFLFSLLVSIINVCARRAHCHAQHMGASKTEAGQNLCAI